MTDRLQHALRLQADGFYVFPLKPNAKTPAHKGWQNEATRDAAAAHAWFNDGYNIGIFTGKFGDDGSALLVVDVDNKEGKNGDAEILRLELEGLELPPTRETLTPTGGRHVFYRVQEAVKNAAGRTIANGLDVRSRGGYVVGPGSRTKHGEYLVASGSLEVAWAPAWLVQRLHIRRPERADEPDVGSRVIAAPERGARFLAWDAPLAVQGQGGDETTYKVAARLKDIGCSEANAYALMLEHWNDRCSPPWGADELHQKVRNAYAYGTLPPGAAAPENDFSTIPLLPAKNAEVSSPWPWLDEMNRRYAVTTHYGKTVVHERVYDHEMKQVAHRWITFDDLIKRHLPEDVMVPDSRGRVVPTSKGEAWLKSPHRRQYAEEAFVPGEKLPDNVLNLWQGFAFEPRPGDWSKFRAHIQGAICGGDTTAFEYVMNWLARAVQRPALPGQVAIVLRGDEGAGKGFLGREFAGLFGPHGRCISQKKHLVGNFNSHLAHVVALFADEALFAGDPSARGPLFALITEDFLQIEPKGVDLRATRNRLHIVMATNEDWAVPASVNARRFCVLDVSSAHLQDIPYFAAISKEMDSGGREALLHDLLTRDISAFDVYALPRTRALLDQKIESLEPFPQWWLSCLSEGRIAFSDFGSAWPADAIDCERFRAAFRRWARERNIRDRIPDDRVIGRDLKKMKTGIFHKNSANGYVYKLPDLAEARKRWNAYIGHDVEWSE